MNAKTIEFSERSRLLEQTAFEFSLQDIPEPNLYRELFPYDEVPKVSFNHRKVPLHMPDHIWITDTTFRDGQQSRAPYTVEQIVHLFKLLHKLGGPKGLIRASEFFLYSEKDKKAVYECQSLGYEFPEITSWIRASRKDFELVKDMEIKETGMLVSCSDYHIFNKLKMTRKQALEHYLDVVKQALEFGIIPRCHFEDITRADFYGFVVPFAAELMKLSKENGIQIKIRACDTMGFGVTYPGAALPRSVQGIIYGLRHHAHVPSEAIEWHGHNDFYRVVNNSTNAWLYGAASVNCSLLGIGERTGNCPLEAMVFEYAQLRGTLDGMDPTAITEIARYYEKELGYKIPPQTPFVGRNFNVTRAGIHADGLLKDEEIYNIFDTGKILGRPPEVAITNVSGLAGIAHWYNGFYHPDQPIDKNHPMIVKMKEKIDEMFAEGRSGAMADEELEAMVQAFSTASAK